MRTATRLHAPDRRNHASVVVIAVANHVSVEAWGKTCQDLSLPRKSIDLLVQTLRHIHPLEFIAQASVIIACTDAGNNCHFDTSMLIARNRL